VVGSIGELPGNGGTSCGDPGPAGGTGGGVVAFDMGVVRSRREGLIEPSSRQKPGSSFCAGFLKSWIPACAGMTTVYDVAGFSKIL